MRWRCDPGKALLPAREVLPLHKLVARKDLDTNVVTFETYAFDASEPQRRLRGRLAFFRPSRGVGSIHERLVRRGRGRGNDEAPSPPPESAGRAAAPETMVMWRATTGTEEGVELPSDLGGLLYIPLDDRGAWQLTLARELKAAGIPVDAEKLVSR